MSKPLHDVHSYGFEIREINGGKFFSDATYVVIEPEADEDGYYLECRSLTEAEEELTAHVNFVVAEGY